MQSEIYAVIFNETGLMAGVGLQGSKISRIDRLRQADPNTGV